MSNFKIDRIYISLSKIYPKHLVKAFQELLNYSGKRDIDAEQYLGKAVLFGILLMFAAFGTKPFFGLIKSILLGIGLFAVIQILWFLNIYYKNEKRTKQINEKIPDLLLLISSNLRAGMTPYHAIRSSIRKDFGPLSEEIELATKRALGINSLGDELKKAAKRNNSIMFERVVKILTSSLKSGGRLAEVLEEQGKDFQETKNLRNELVTNTKTYTAFIFFTVLIGMPLLLAISIQFVDIVTAMQEQTSGNVSAEFSSLTGEISITTEFISVIAIILLILTPTLASILIGVIAEGKILSGLRVAPALIALCIIIFNVCKIMVANFIGST